jgi:hypothetical protein
MTPRNLSLRRPRVLGALTILALLLAGGTPSARAQAAYPEPETAADALIAAVKSDDGKALAKVLGSRWRELMPNGVDPEDRQAFLDKAAQSHKVERHDGSAELSVGDDAWVLPIPLRQGSDGQWRFDPSGGRVAMLERRLGLNERSAIQAMLAYVDAQREYALADRNGDGVLEYAQRLVSSPGKRDGLIWSERLGDDSPLGEAFVPARPGQGYHGYRFRILTGQGPAAPGGARSYLIGKRMTSGFGLLAWPVKYGESGVMTFIVDQDAVVYQRDLGPDTARAAQGIKRFDPGDGWTQVRP